MRERERESGGGGGCERRDCDLRKMANVVGGARPASSTTKRSCRMMEDEQSKMADTMWQVYEHSK